ncbi:MAG TPA: alkaline phosphatase D family protein [Thermoanaerobaculia bacterium]|nr:alkaline phosphatase D family protein [Thermoanaerobaculia bacterium]
MTFRTFLLILALSIAACEGNSAAEHAAPAPAADAARFVSFVWSGAVTPGSATVKARLLEEGARARLVVSSREDLSEPLYTEYHAAAASRGNMVAFTVKNLKPDTVYHYAVEVNGRVDKDRQGRFRTFADGPASFRIALGSCAETGSNHPVFDTIREREPLFFLHMGDFHYEDLHADRQSAYRGAFDRVFASPRQSLLYRSVPVVYMWDDHDFGGNNSDSTNPGRKAVRLTYQEYVPHYPLPAGQGDVPPYQAFTVGRVRFVVTDLRSERSSPDLLDDSAKTMMGAKQKDWFENEVRTAQEAGQLIVWMSTPPWIETPGRGSDRWGGYATERREIADFLRQNHIDRMVMLAGDAHMVALDDGSHTGYATGGGPGFPVLHAAALDRPGSIKGGPYSGGTFPNRSRKGDGQFGILEVQDDGGAKICVDLSGWRYEGDTGGVSQLVELKRCFPVPPLQAGTPPTSGAPPS